VLRWFLVHTKPAREETAKTHLERQGYHIYHPRLHGPTLSRGRWVDRIVSLFPCYLFLQLDVANQSIAPVRSSVGVSDIVRFGMDYAVVSNKIIESLIERSDPKTGLHLLNRGRPFEPGAVVQVVAGAFRGLEGIFDRADGRDRVAVFLRLMGHEVLARVPSNFVLRNHAA
jgi:transcriptional antiterminator RfaH